MKNLELPARLGIGINYSEKIISLLKRYPGAVDYLEFSPDMLCEERINGNNKYFDLNPARMQKALAVCKYYPVVVHGLGLSIGSVSGWNDSYLDLLDKFQSEVDFAWHSEHLGFSSVEMPNGDEVHAGTLLPMLFTRTSIELLAHRIQYILDRYQKPFLMENTTSYLPEYPASDWDEVDFLNQLVESSGCGLILDVYNFYCNAINFAFDPREALARLNIESVVELHVAGGVVHDGFLLDVHSDCVPEEVWSLTEWVLARAPNVRGVTYEILEQAISQVGEDGIYNQLLRARKIWNNYSGSEIAIREATCVPA